MMMLDEQLRLEEAMSSNAAHRQAQDNHKSTARGAWSETKLGSRYQRSLSQAFGATVKAKLAEYAPGKPGSNARALKLLTTSGLEPEVIAHLFIKQLLASMPAHRGKRMKRVTVCIRAAELIHDEMRIRHFASVKERRNLLKKLFKQFDKRTYPRHWRKRTIMNYFHAEQLSWQQWAQKEKLLVGYALMVWFRDSTGMIEADKSSPYIDPTNELIEHVEHQAKARVLDYLIYKPMVVKPKPWSESNLFRGGYISDKIKPYPLVKRTGRKDADEMAARDWSQIIPAINAIQETPWRINKTILQVLNWTFNDRRGGTAGLPKADPTPLPPEPTGYRIDEKVTKDHNKVCFLIHSDNREMVSKRLALLQTIAIAQQFKEFESIFFCHNMDSRGRAYPVPAFLNAQGPDYCKALLEFTRGEPIETHDQACWLAIVGANAYGNDKVSLQDRVDWVADNEQMILSIADNPYKDARWTDTSEPFQFLRFCLEWKQFMTQGFGFVSHMVCFVDATCSGLQHYSALLRDEIGGRAVNLVPGLTRQDIYQDVADLVIDKLMNTTGPDQRLASNIIGIDVDRKITKRQVMVVPYSGTFASCMAYTREALREKFKSGVVPPWNVKDREEDQKHVTLLSRYIWDSIDEVVVKGKEAMNWLTKATRAYVKLANRREGTLESKAITWVTPDGFVVRHYAPDLKKKQVATYLDGRVDLVLYEPTSKLSAQDTSQAVAPNFVHSLDACLLRASVMRGLSLPKPITSYGMIHDSFGVHASRMAEFLSQCVKPAFVSLYRTDMLVEFRDRLVAADDLGLDPLPSKGTLDLDGVLESEFFFS